MTLEFSVYELVDPRDGKPFYIGQTKDPEGRKRRHNSKKFLGGPCFERVQAIREDGMNLQFRILSTHPTRREARIAERRAVISTPDLLNSLKCALIPDT